MPGAHHQEEAQEEHRPGEDQDVDRLEKPCMIAMLIVIIQFYETVTHISFMSQNTHILRV